MSNDSEAKLAELYSQFPLAADSREVLEKAVGLSYDHVGSEHILFSLLGVDEIQNLLTQLSIDIGQLSVLTAEYIVDDFNSPETDGLFTRPALEAIVQADNERHVRNEFEIYPIDLLLGMLAAESGMGFILLYTAENGMLPAPEIREEAKADLSERIRHILLG